MVEICDHSESLVFRSDNIFKWRFLFLNERLLKLNCTKYTNYLISHYGEVKNIIHNTDKHGIATGDRRL